MTSTTQITTAKVPGIWQALVRIRRADCDMGARLLGRIGILGWLIAHVVVVLAGVPLSRIITDNLEGSLAQYNRDRVAARETAAVMRTAIDAMAVAFRSAAPNTAPEILHHDMPSAGGSSRPVAAVEANGRRQLIDDRIRLMEVTPSRVVLSMRMSQQFCEAFTQQSMGRILDQRVTVLALPGGGLPHEVHLPLTATEIRAACQVPPGTGPDTSIQVAIAR